MVQFAKVFLSHSHADAELVRAVADGLARRGVLPWLDKRELLAGDDLGRELKAAIEAGTEVAVFVSEASLASAWVQEELRIALRCEKETGRRVLPISQSSPTELVRRYPELKAQWIDANGRLDRIFVVEGEPELIAQAIAERCFSRLGLADCSDVLLYVDQRASSRTGVPKLEPPLQKLDLPCLVFRPKYGEPGSARDVVADAAWRLWQTSMTEALSVLGGGRKEPRTVRIAGHSQLGVPYFLGRVLNRTHGFRMWAYPSMGQDPFHVDFFGDWRAATGNVNCTQAHDALAGRPGPSCASPLDLLVMKQDHLHSTCETARATRSHVPLAWIPHDGDIQTVADIEELARNIDAFLNVRAPSEINLFTTLPFHALAILGALSAPHGMRNVCFWEYCSAESSYVPLELSA